MSRMFSVGLRGLPEAAERLQQFRSDMEGADDEGVKAMATLVRNAARAALRQPGSGREYPSRVGRTVRTQTKSLAKLQSRVDAGELDYRGATSKQKSALKRSQARLRKTLRRLDRATPGGLHRASAPGEAPAPDVGLLPQAVKAGVLDGTRVVGVGGRWEGWEALHEGRGRVKSPRPFLQLAIDRVKSKLVGVYISAVRGKGVFDG